LADLSETARLLLKSFIDQVSGPLKKVEIEVVTDLQLHPEANNSFSCSVVLKKGEKTLPAEKIYVSFTNFPMIKFFGRTWTEFQGESGIGQFVTGIQDRFHHQK